MKWDIPSYHFPNVEVKWPRYIFCLFMFLYNLWKHPLILEQKDKESYEMNDYIISAKNKRSTVYCTLKNINDTVKFLINTQVFG